MMKPPRYWSVVTVSEAKVRRTSDIGDIQEIDEMGALLEVGPLPGNRVEVKTRRETYTVCEAFVALELAEQYACEVLQREIARLQRKYDRIAEGGAAQ